MKLRSSQSVVLKDAEGSSRMDDSPGRLRRLLSLPQWTLRVGTLFLAATICAILLTLFGGALNAIEERVGALGWTLFSDPSIEERVTLVVIDEPSIAEVGAWPWSRSDMARLVSAIDDMGAQLQLHDITYPETKTGDEDFLQALMAAEGAVIAQIPVLSEQFKESSTGLMTHPLVGLACDPQYAGLNLTSATSYIGATANLETVPKGHNAAIIDPDGAVRQSPAAVCIEGAAYPALSIAAFLQMSSASEWRADIDKGTSLFGPRAIMSLEGYPGLEIPMDESGSIRISFAKAPEAFRAVSAADVMNKRVDASLFDDAWVIIGGTAFGMADIIPTPYSGSAFGVELQARLLTSILDVNVPYSPVGAPLLLNLVCLVFAALLYSLAKRAGRMAAYGMPVAAVSMPVLSALVHIWILSSFNLWVGWIMPALFGLLGASGMVLLELGRVRLERATVFGNLNSYLPKDVARDIAFSLPSSSVNAHRSDVTLLSADLRNFSAFTEARPPEEIAALLHFFLTRATEVVEEQGGQIQEFRGDGILAVWDSATCATAQRALQAAKSLQASLKDSLLIEGAKLGLEPLALGVGIEQGPVMIGSIGPAHGRSYTVLGDTVSITLRIQEMTVELAQPILLGECVSRHLSDVNLQSQGSYLLEGLRIPHTLFAPAPQSNDARADSFPSSPNFGAARSPDLSVVDGGKP